MSSSTNGVSRHPTFERLTHVIGPSAPHLGLFTLILLLLLYGYEIFNFSLSIDEELYGSVYQDNWWLIVISQGRWATGLLARAFPPIGDIPMISTILFCAGLGVGACILARLLFRNHSAQLAFVGIFISSPLWPHLAEFNISSWCVGIGCVLVSLALMSVLSGNSFGDICAGSLLAVAIGIGETFFFWFLVLLGLRYLSVLLGTTSVDATQTRRGFPWLRSGLIAVGGLLGYLAIQRLLFAALRLKLIYVQGYMRLVDFTAGPGLAFTRTIRRCWSLLSGSDPIYLGYGHVLTLLPLLGLLIVSVRLLRRGPLRASRRLLAGAIVVTAIVLAMSPIILSAGIIPSRTLIAWIPISAFLGAVTFSNSGRFKLPLYFALGVSLFISIWISVSLFYSDHLARQRDQLLAARIMTRVDQLLPDPPPGRIPFVVVGSPPPNEFGPFHNVQVFGDSFFGAAHEGGNPFRVAAYLRLLGVDTLEPHQLADVDADRPDIEAMPVWPAAGSVAILKGILVIKLGPVY